MQGNMMKRKIKNFLIFLTIAVTAPFLPSCNADSYRETGYEPNREKYFYGIQETGTPSPGGFKNWRGGTSDAYLTQDMIADLSGSLGVGTYRLWMNLDNIFSAGSNSTLILDNNSLAFFKGFIAKLIAKGVDNIVAVNCGYLYPAGYIPDNFWPFGVFPDPATEAQIYKDFMSLTEIAYARLAELFPEIKYWECGNETNEDMYCNKKGYVQETWKTDRDLNRFTYSFEEKARITTDLMFYSARGIKAGNPSVQAVMPGLVFNINSEHGIAPFLTKIYDNIASGNYPTANVILNEKTTDPSRYFDILNWHPYEFGGRFEPESVFIALNKQLFAIAVENGDADKKAFFTEFGWSSTQDFSLEDLAYKDRSSLENSQAAYLANAIKTIRERLPQVESVIFFRLFDWETVFTYTWPTETGFGFFTSPGTVDVQGLKDIFDWEYPYKNYYEGFRVCKPESVGGNYPGPRPKPVALKLFELINGIDAPKDSLYRYFGK
jgi:hypothetical protein